MGSPVGVNVQVQKLIVGGEDFLAGKTQKISGVVAKGQKLTITLGDGTVVEHVFDVEQRTYETERIDGLPDDEVRLDAELRDRPDVRRDIVIRDGHELDVLVRRVLGSPKSAIALLKTALSQK